MNCIAHNNETFQIQLYVALVQQTVSVFTSELPTSQNVTKEYIMVASKYSKLYDAKSKFWEKKML
jgi:hypothetical protein